MRADAQTEAELAAVFDAWRDATAREDGQAVLAIFAPDADVVVFGTGTDETYVGYDAVRAGVERDFAQSEDFRVEFGWSSYSAAGNVAWVAREFHARADVDGREVGVDGRLTVVLEKRNGRWLIVQSHASVPAADQPEGESFPTG